MLLEQVRWRFQVAVLLCWTGWLAAGCSPTPDRTETVLPVETTLPTLAVPPPGRDTAIVFTIPNEAPASGIAGEPAPDWPAWGAPAFTIAPDGSFWILDTAAAHPPRLLQFNPHGDLQIEIPIEESVIGAADLAVSGDAVRVLAITSQPAQLVSFDLQGRLLSSIPIPEALYESGGTYVSNQLDDLQLGQAGEILLKGPAGPELYEFMDSSGGVTARRLDGFAYAGHLYRVELPDRLYIDDRPVEITPAAPDGRVVEVDLLGVRPDGGFYAAAVEEQMRDGEPAAYIRIVHAYSLAGEHLGLALPPESAFPVESNRDLALGPDGSLYALVSRADHSVDILRLGFTPDFVGLSVPAATPSPAPARLSPLMPAWTTPPAGVADLEIARSTLLAFFAFLHEGQYAEAAPLYGGPLEAVTFSDPGSAPADLARLWEEACLILRCLPVAAIIEEAQVAPDAFRFLVEFVQDDGFLFVLGPCCGASEADMPPVWKFWYTVRVIDGGNRVIEPPVYVP